MLDCSGKNLTGSLLDHYSMEELMQYSSIDCSENKLTDIPNLPGLQFLDCYMNELTTLPNFPGLIELDCSRNKLTTLPNLIGLQVLECSRNKLTTLPNIIGLQDLTCFYNPFTFQFSHHIFKWEKYHIYKLDFQMKLLLIDLISNDLIFDIKNIITKIYYRFFIDSINMVIAEQLPITHEHCLASLL